MTALQGPGDQPERNRLTPGEMADLAKVRANAPYDDYPTLTREDDRPVVPWLTVLNARERDDGALSAWLAVPLTDEERAR